MRKQNSLFSIRSAGLLLVLSLILVSGYGYAQTQFAYTTGISNGNPPHSISQVRTSDNIETATAQVSLFWDPQGIALADNDVIAFVTLTGCSGPTNPCVSRVDITTSQFIVTPLFTAGPAEFVAVTPSIPTLGGCRFAYVTTSRANVSVINVCTNAVSTFPLPAGTLSRGVAVAYPNGSPEVWVSDSVQANRRVFAINPSNGNTEQISLMCPDGCTGSCCPSNAPFPQHIAYAAISSTEYRMYVTDSAPGNKAVWVIKNIINGNTITRSVYPIRWTRDGELVDTFPYGIAVRPSESKAYVTAPGDNRRLYIIAISQQGETLSSILLPLDSFETPRGVAPLATDSRVYVANQLGSPTPNLLTIVNPDTGLVTPIRLVGGNPFWIALTSGIYTGSATWPAPEARIH